MPLREDLLQPIAGANPAGVDLRYDPLYDKIKEARREDDDAPQGDWQRARKTADWPLVIKLASDAIATKSKDLQLAAWLTEAALRREGVGGLRQGLELCRGLLDNFWDGLYPEIDDGDAEMRAAPLEWIGLKLDVAVRMAPLTRGGHDLLRYNESRAVGYEADATEQSKLEARERAIEEGRLTAEEFDKAFDATPKAWYKALAADMEAASTALEALDATGREKFGDVAPSYGKLRGALEEVQRTAAVLLRTKLQREPDPVEVNEAAAVGANGAPAGGEPASVAASGAVTAGVDATSRDDAAARAVSAARYLRRSEPTNPAAYLLLRGFRWGELRAAGDPPDPKLLDAPATQVRTQLKRLLLDRQWAQLLELGEQVMGTPQGRGWLDLQRYVLTATDNLGVEYAQVGAAIRTELRALLADLPSLLDMTLMDDTPTANAETREWLKVNVGAAGVPAASNGDRPGHGEGYTAHVRDRALAEVRAGNPERAVELLMRELSREKTRRGRFLGQTLLAHIMVDAGHEAVAMPILEELLQSVETYHLEEWEAGNVVAEPMALLYRCLAKLEGDPTARQSLYLRICRLDPLRAIEFSQQGAAQLV
jgi:type VI secretion system protein ImpA